MCYAAGNCSPRESALVEASAGFEAVLARQRVARDESSAFVRQDAVDQMPVDASVALAQSVGELTPGECTSAAQQMQRIAEDTLTHVAGTAREARQGGLRWRYGC